MLKRTIIDPAITEFTGMDHLRKEMRPVEGTKTLWVCPSKHLHQIRTDLRGSAGRDIFLERLEIEIVRNRENVFAQEGDRNFWYWEDRYGDCYRMIECGPNDPHPMELIQPSCIKPDILIHKFTGHAYRHKAPKIPKEFGFPPNTKEIWKRIKEPSRLRKVPVLRMDTWGHGCVINRLPMPLAVLTAIAKYDKCPTKYRLRVKDGDWTNAAYDNVELVGAELPD